MSYFSCELTRNCSRNTSLRASQAWSLVLALELYCYGPSWGFCGATIPLPAQPCPPAPAASCKGRACTEPGLPQACPLTRLIHCWSVQKKRQKVFSFPWAVQLGSRVIVALSAGHPEMQQAGTTPSETTARVTFRKMCSRIPAPSPVLEIKNI